MDDTSDSELSSAPSSPSPPPESIPSSPLSYLSRSPTPPGFLLDLASMANRPRAKVRIPMAAYPSPPASLETSQSGSPTPDGMDSSTHGQPPAKRRRVSRDPKERTTEYLDLRSGTVDPEQQESLERVLNVLHKRQKVVVIAGAGMSKSAGVPDFRSKEGLFSSLKKEHNLKGSGQHLFDASVYKNDASTEHFHSMISQMSRLTKDTQPTPFHHMLATMAKDGRLLRLYSQNVDCLETNMEPLRTRTPLTKDEAGKWPRTVQLHGGLDKMVCTKCHEISDLNADLFDGPDAPLCPTCDVLNNLRTIYEGKRSHGIGRLRPRMVLYHEQGPDESAIGAVSVEDLRRRPDAVIVVGTTLKVKGLQRLVKEMCGVVRNRKDGGLAIWINPDPPPASQGFRDCFDIIVQGTCDEVAERAAMRSWDEPLEPDDFSEVSEEDAAKLATKTAQVVLPLCQPMHCSMVSLPSADHINNSFRPPPHGATPQPARDFGPEDWSPISSRGSSAVLPSIEIGIPEGEHIIVAHEDYPTGLATPSKSSRSTPVKQQPSAFAQLKDTSKSRKASTKAVKSSATAKQIAISTIKGVKPKSKAKSSASKSKPQQSTVKANALTNTFGQSKSASTAAKNAVAKSYSLSPAKSASKLRQVLNASVDEPMTPYKNKSSPARPKTPHFPNLFMGNAVHGVKRKSVGT